MPSATRATILEATRRLSVTEGFRAITMRKVAAEVGLTAPAIYRHFASKGELIEALLEEARGAFLGYLTQALEGGSAWERLMAAQNAYLRFALERPDAYELLMLTPNQLGLFRMPNSLDRWRNEPPPAFQLCVDRVAECMRAGDLTPGDPTEVALAISGLAHGLVSQFLAGRFGPDHEGFTRLYAASLEHLYRGVRATSSEPDVN
ncbi:MAG: TetR/AcrR family transcriptional regulator [Planctomycetota bacterium]